MVAQAALSRRVWLGAALAAVALLVVLAFGSPDRQQSLVAYQAAGLMRHLQAQQVRSVRLAAGSVEQVYRRGIDGRWERGDGKPADPRVAEAIDGGLRLLRNTPPERSFDAESPAFGLAAPALRVEVQPDQGPPFTAEFGATNPIGMANYVRVRSAGGTSLYLMPTYLSEAWAAALHQEAT